ncbi:AI-2E family transporter [Flavihumibacter cheonanensis]|uniref:AI-2E family transporter n=1 Tax=Flavihumibacter cheonanensis TaxID=1442385 RepID=UPI001EF7D813|nr:AI-2E family transporter [Flavihumibacter cheonanensis]MCG7751442.1 AI-2E family transporter [Flavihumibacter cheonanensis]
MKPKPSLSILFQYSLLVFVTGGLLAIFVWQFNFFLLIFSSILLSILFHAISVWIEKKLKLRYSWALVITLVSIALVLTGFFLIAGPSVSKQLDEISSTLPKSIDQLKKAIQSHPVGKKLIKELPKDPGKAVTENKDLLTKAASYVGSFLGVLGNMLIVLIAAIFQAASPTNYFNGLVRLFPDNKKKAVSNLIRKVYQTLATWLAAKFASMLVVGLATGIGLALLGVPLAFILALIAAGCTFIPYIGPYLALVPAVLVGLLESQQMALYIVILYFSIQIIESYFITPMIEKKMVELPPALALFWQVLMGILAGAIGLLLASPMLAALLIIIQETYIRKIEHASNRREKEEAAV